VSLGADLAGAVDPVRFGQRLGFQPEPWQARLLRTTARRVLVRCARQTGKSTTTGLKGLHVAMHNPGRDVLIVAPTQRQSTELLTRVRGHYRALAGAPRLAADNESQMTLVNGARVISLPGSEGGIRGFANVRLLLLDEAARIEDGVFASTLPMVGSDGQVMALSTPWGQRGWWWQLHEEPANGWQRHAITVHESAQYDARRIAEVRASLGSFIFRSDYLCEFSDTDEQLFSSEGVRRAFTPAVRPLFERTP
jgi:hypothetical protein